MRAARPDYSLVTAIEGRALQSEGNGPVPWSGLQTELRERIPGRNASAEVSTKDGINYSSLCLLSSRLTPRSTQCRSFSSNDE